MSCNDLIEKLVNGGGDVKRSVFMVGAGRAEIEFCAEMLPTEGFCGIHDLPAVRVLCMESGDRAVIVSAEMVMLDPFCIEKSKQIISDITKTAPENIWIHVTHTISTPHTPGPVGPPDKRPPLTCEDKRKMELYYAAILAAMERAAKEAAANFSEAVLGIGTGDCFVNRNRDVQTDHGWWIGLGDGNSNRRMTVVKMAGKNGETAAVLISYGIKPCILDNSEMKKGTRLISSDLCGAACRQMEKELNVPVLFCMSAAGDQVPREMALVERVTEKGEPELCDLGVKSGLEMVSRLGDEMARDALGILQRVVCAKVNDELRTAADSFCWPTKARRPMKPAKESECVPEGSAQVDVAVIRLGELAFVAAKPEINMETERQLHQAAETKTTVLISMVNGGQKYMPEYSAYERNTWEAQSAMLMPGAAEQFVERAANLINEL